jgi:phosphoribosylformylglycinamidine cyclo-ligase
VTTDAYARSGVDQHAADRAVAALVGVLRTIDPGRPSRSVLGSGHYAAVLEVAPNLGIAVGTDGVGSKLILAEQAGRFDTVGIDCVAMNANDVVCVGAEPFALLDYIAVERADADVLAAIGEGLKAGAEQAGVEIPGGEVAVLPELIRGHPSPRGFDLVGACFGTVELDAVVSGAKVRPGDAVIGIPSSGVHSNGLTLARRALPSLDERPAELGGATVGETLLEPTVIYVRAVTELLRSGADVRGLAHITSGGLLNLLRLDAAVGYDIDTPLPRLPVFELIAGRSRASEAELLEVFNMGCGFCVVVPDDQTDVAVELLDSHHGGTAVIGHVTDEASVVRLPGLVGRADTGFTSS